MTDMSQKVNHSLGPKGDVSYIRATPTGSLPPKSPPPCRDTNLTPLSQFSGMDFELNQREEMLSKELEEARIRASQMEKTMRWWSDCTANWREKWNKARNERNKARDENRQLRSKIDAVVKECNLLKRQKQDMKSENDSLKKQLNLPSDEDKDKVSETSSEDNTSKNLESVTTVSTTDACEHLDKVDSEKETDETDLTSAEKNDETVPEKLEKLESSTDVTSPGQDLAGSVQDLLQLKLDQAQKTVVTEKQDKSRLKKTVEKLQTEMVALRSKYDDQKACGHQDQEELTKLKADHQDEVRRITQDLEEENSSRSALEGRLGELRADLERLQVENSAEWGKRERLESEKLSLERDKKKLQSQVLDLEEQLQQKCQQASAVVDSDLRTMQFDLTEKNKELTELRHLHAKAKKTLQDRNTELDHTKRRSEQYEVEVRKLRGRIEELKKELATAEDEVDTQSNMVRKLQRTNDDLQEQADNLQVQVEHLQSRLRRNSQPASTGRPTSLKSFTLDDTGDADDSDLDDDIP